MINIWNALSSNLWPFTIALINIWAVCQVVEWILLIIQAVLKILIKH